MINPQKLYSLKEIAELNLLEVKHPTSVIRIILGDTLTNNYLKPAIMGRGEARRYWIRGENIIKYLANKDDEKKYNN